MELSFEENVLMELLIYFPPYSGPHFVTPSLSLGVGSRVSNVSNTFLCKKHLKTLYVKQKG